MTKLRSFAGLIAILALGACLFAVGASAAHRTARVACTARVKGHTYNVTYRVMSCAKAVGYVKTTAAERISQKNQGSMPHSPKGYRCTAYSNKQNVQTFGTCRALKGSSGFDWTLSH